ncbi:MAG: hypothetical protein L3J33_00340 [Rhodobacteraceae bacterium]|nr:hypothetical protein [Paracoccaceae bacterium]
MSNPQHLEWLLEGVEAWNARRREDDYVPYIEDKNVPQRILIEALQTKICP